MGQAIITSLLFLGFLVPVLSISPKYRCLGGRGAFPKISRRNNVLALGAGKAFGSKPNAEVYFCSECGAEHINWMGRCSSCKQWNTVKAFRAAREDAVPSSPLNIRARAAAIKGGAVAPGAGFSSSAVAFGGGRFTSGGNSSLLRMDSVEIDVERQRMPLFSHEVNRVLGGGMVKGSVVLLAGEPGVGKSTLLLQMAASLVKDKHGQVVYISGEESAEQIVSRARRLGINVADLFLICDIDADDAIDNLLAMSTPPAMVIVDSVQTMRSASVTGSVGSVTQTRESAARFVQLAKATGSAVVLAGHVTKSGEVAGPRILEHMVDTVLYMEGSERQEFRLLRGVKNRFGSTAEVGVLGMGGGGLFDVSNPSQLFLSQNVMSEGQEGAAVAVVMEGSRPLLAEIQCLVSLQAPQAKFNTKRMSDGFPIQRLLLICAVIEKRLKLPLWSRDIYINVAGGLRLSEPCSDLAVAITVISSMTGAKIRAGTALIGEIGLGGELRGGKGIEARVTEARKMGFTRVVVPLSAGYRDGSAANGAGGGGARTAAAKALSPPPPPSPSPSPQSSLSTTTAPTSVATTTQVLSCRSLRDALPLIFEDATDVDTFLKPARRQRKYGLSSYRPGGAEAEAEADGLYGDGDGESESEVVAQWQAEAE